MNTLDRVVAIFKSTGSPRANRNVVASALAILCVALWVSGAFLVQQQGPSRSTSNNAGVPENPSSARGVRMVVPEPAPVFSIMRTDAVRNKLLAATSPRPGSTGSIDNDERAELGGANQEDQEEARERKE